MRPRVRGKQQDGKKREKLTFFLPRVTLRKEERPCKKHGTAALRIHHYTHKQKMNIMMVCDWDLQFNKYNIYINIYIIS